MVEFLFSNYMPVKTSYPTFSERFYKLLYDTDELNIAVGFVTADSLAELQKIIELNNKPKLKLSIGMHYFDGFTKLEYQAAKDLNKFLSENGLGKVFLANAFRFHGKVYSFIERDNPFAGIIGSNNLSSIGDKSRVYEASAFIDDKKSVLELQKFIDMLTNQACKPLEDYTITRFRQNNPLLDDHFLVSKISQTEVLGHFSQATNIRFNIPLKASPQHMRSNLNVFFGKGREASHGIIKPRHWYEAEIIVSNMITSQNGYPEVNTDNAVFDVITDDGWLFKCKVSGDYSKNFRSEGDLKILGKWIKGRMEQAGALKIGEPVTEDTLRKYGRADFELIKSKKEGLWLLNFGVK